MTNSIHVSKTNWKHNAPPGWIGGWGPRHRKSSFCQHFPFQMSDLMIFGSVFWIPTVHFGNVFPFKWTIRWFLIRFWMPKTHFVNVFPFQMNNSMIFDSLFGLKQFILSTFFLSKWSFSWFLIRFLNANSSFWQRFSFQNEHFDDFRVAFLAPKVHFDKVFPFQMNFWIAFSARQRFWKNRKCILRSLNYFFKILPRWKHF